jgi:hypothetical protein
VTGGYASATVDGGVEHENGSSVAEWALTSPGNVDYNALQDFAFNGLIDGALIAKSIIKTFYHSPPTYSYWDGCSQGGRQGYLFAQRFPDVFDGIAAAAPAINWSPFFFAGTYPHQVFYELNATGFPHPCEFEALEKAAIAACDGLDGLIDGLISDPDKCYIDPRTLVGSAVNCSATGGPSTISANAAIIMEAVWEGPRTQNGSFLWYPAGYEVNGGSLEAPGPEIIGSTCNNGTCTPLRATLFTDWIKYFIEKNPDYNLNNMTRAEWVEDFVAGEREYKSIINTDFPDLSGLRRSGGKLLTWHGLVSTVQTSGLYKRLTFLVKADGAIPYGGTRDYFDRVSVLDPELRDYYRYFEAPGARHCIDGQGGSPHETFQALVDWVEKGIAPETLTARNTEDKERLLCLYPKKAVFKGNPSEYTAQDFVCE